MCGIVSLFRVGKPDDRAVNTQVEELFKNLLWIDSIRGEDSTGLLWKYASEDEPAIYKKPVPGWDFVQLDIPKKLIDTVNQMPFIIGHNRAATRGTVSTENAHPFQFGHISGVHNGTLSNHHNLSPVGANHNVDSQHLYHAISEDGFAEVVNKVKGSFALLWHDQSDDTVHMCKNMSRPYTFAKLKNKDFLVGASEKPMLKWLIKKHGFEIEYCWSPKDNMEYIWKVDGNSLQYDREVQYEGYVEPPPPPKKENVAYLPRSQDKDIGGRQTGSEEVEFFLDTSVRNNTLQFGKQTHTMYGETIDGVEVCIFCVTDDDHLQYETWYKARGVFIPTVSSMQDYYRIFKDTITLHPLEEVEPDALQICTNCGEDHAESDGLMVDNAPLCLTCAHNLSVKPDQVDSNDAWKLFVSPKHYH